LINIAKLVYFLIYKTNDQFFYKKEDVQEVLKYKNRH